MSVLFRFQQPIAYPRRMDPVINQLLPGSLHMTGKRGAENSVQISSTIFAVFVVPFPFMRRYAHGFPRL